MDDTHHDRMMAAFNVVDPTCEVRGTNWRDRISIFGTQSAFDAAARHFGVTFNDVLESVRYLTATEPTVTPVDEAGLLHITADGYRAGPAGDH